MERRGKRAGTRTDEAETGWYGLGEGKLKYYGVRCRCTSVPCCVVGDKVGPKRRGEAVGNYDGAARI